jgi:hypothetical protein
MSKGKRIVPTGIKNWTGRAFVAWYRVFRNQHRWSSLLVITKYMSSVAAILQSVCFTVSALFLPLSV